MELAIEAVLSALDDAGLSPDDVNGLTSFGSGVDHGLLARHLGVGDVAFTADVPGGGGGSAGALGLAALAVSQGAAEVVVTVKALQQNEYRLGRGDSTSGPYVRQATPDRDFVRPFGMLSPAHKFAMIAQRHMYLYGTSREAFAEVAISTRRHAATRETSLMRSELTLDEYLGSRPIADPLCLYDMCLETDGAVAVITTSQRRAESLRQRPVSILATAMGGEGNLSKPEIAWACSDDSYFASGLHGEIARQLYGKAGLSPQDIDVALLYDHFGPMVLLQLEDYGFCNVGDAADFALEGNLRWPSGALPTNTHGGNLSEAYIMGMTHILEAVEQLRGQAVNQVDGAEVALVTGGPASLPVSSALLARS